MILSPKPLEDANMAKLATTVVLLALATTMANAQAQQQSGSAPSRSDRADSCERTG
jgi:hypothetical protein